MDDNHANRLFFTSYVMMVICIGESLLLLGPWLPCPGLWANLGLVFPDPGCGLIVGFCLLFFFFWIIKNLFPKRAEPQQQLKNSTKPAAIREYENGQHLP